MRVTKINSVHDKGYQQLGANRKKQKKTLHAVANPVRGLLDREAN